MGCSLTSKSGISQLTAGSVPGRGVLRETAVRDDARVPQRSHADVTDRVERRPDVAVLARLRRVVAPRHARRLEAVGHGRDFEARILPREDTAGRSARRTVVVGLGVAAPRERVGIVDRAARLRRRRCRDGSGSSARRATRTCGRPAQSARRSSSSSGCRRAGTGSGSACRCAGCRGSGRSGPSRRCASPSRASSQSWPTSRGMRSRAWRSVMRSPVEIIAVVAPSAPGNVPKYMSNDRFSLIRKTMCWMCERNASSCVCRGGPQPGNRGCAAARRRAGRIAPTGDTQTTPRPRKQTARRPVIEPCGIHTGYRGLRRAGSERNLLKHEM